MIVLLFSVNSKVLQEAEEETGVEHYGICLQMYLNIFLRVDSLFSLG